MKEIWFLFFLTIQVVANAQFISSDQVEFWSKVDIKNLNYLNTPNYEFSPIILGETMVYLGQGEGFDYQIYSNTKDKWGQITELNSAGHEGPLCFDKQSQTLFYTQSNRENEIDFTRTLQIYTAKYINNKWIKTGTWEQCNAKHSFCHPSISKDGKTLLFASDMPGGLGKMDLYFSKFEDGSWSLPHNLGPSINSHGNDWFPSIVQDSILCFAKQLPDSDMDIFYSKINSILKPQTAQPFPKPINSVSDDFSIVFEEDLLTAYISSNRNSSVGLDDIFQISFPHSIINQGVKKHQIAILTHDQFEEPISNVFCKFYPIEYEEVDQITALFSQGSDQEIDQYILEKGDPKLEVITSNLGKTQVYMTGIDFYLVLIDSETHLPDWNIINGKALPKEMIFTLFKK